MKFEAEGQEFAKFLRSLEQSIWTVKEIIGIMNRQEKLAFSFPEKILQKNNRDMMQEILNAGSIEEKA